MIPVTIDRNDNPPAAKPGGDFRFVDQGNYLKSALVPGLTLYSDSATSCIITIVVAQKGEEISATLAHLDSPDCIKAFFTVVTAENYDSIQIYAQGANPPDNETARQNAAQLKASVESLGSTLAAADLYLLEGSPREDNRGDFGISIGTAGGIAVSNQPYALELTDRDPTCGGQTVYCIMRRQEHPPVEIRNAALPFTHAELVELSSIALSYRKTPDDPASAFTNIVNMQNAAIRESWSTTPQYEAPWFSDQLKQGACFALSMAPVTTLSNYYLSKEHERPFTRLRRAILPVD
ncbi:hypothetical protein [Leisingera methylohalidivorans]|uniref:Uncharacterized protein n=1 Tax=Leisingera methylohalidivorans DSM 14336 TaxID=999552 RepID=V9VYR4_9RHOB|nr:hypothetical protein [Leisingera methylohalidivorans]AHD02879.1 hypothetical protein METH_04135 [Leisingera methylohalidivorans DSM 14336]